MADHSKCWSPLLAGPTPLYLRGYWTIGWGESAPTPSEVFGLKLNINYSLNFLTQTLVTRDLLGTKTACTILLLEIRRSNITYIDVSYSLAICYRVPRGSILGLTPFVICTNDLSQSLMKSSIGMNADDTIIYFFDANAEIIKWLL